MADGWLFGPDLDWQRYAQCTLPGADLVEVKQRADRFFPAGRPSNESKRACGACPVRAECLQWALEHDETGVWGGLSDGERARLKARAS